MKQIIPELYVSNCMDALEYYKNVFGGEIRNVRKADGLKEFKGLEGKIIHSEIHFADGCDIYLVDILDNKNVGSTELVLQMESEEEINRVYDKLSAGSNIKFPLQKAFWGAYHAVVTDKFGVTWGLNL